MRNIFLMFPPVLLLVSLFTFPNSNGNSLAQSSPPNFSSENAIVVTKPWNLLVLVNKTHALPATYKPMDLFDDENLPFIFPEKDEKRLMRKEAALALEKLFSAAKRDGILLSGVSAYRSYETQKTLFSYYVQTKGEEAARRYSAVPGQSEHQTGLAIDIAGANKVCPAENCFANTPEAHWLASHVQNYGFIIRYPQFKEYLTGYLYEPWHIRYVGYKASKKIAQKGLTLEEYIDPR
jgi:zinc D-Ala-D-Ala carboxypeptidase